MRKNYVDRFYRDTYYTYFAAKYKQINRNCKRLFIFDYIFDREDFFCYTDEIEKKLQEHFLGICTLKPINQGKIGRTLIDPFKLHIPAYIRTTEFQFFLFGHNFKINAFPYSSQDGEMMTCAETTTWNILEYYGTRYPEHRTVLPSEMLRSEETFSYERNLPSKGLSVFDISYLLKTFGFAPRICIKEKDSNEEETINKKLLLNFKRMFHYYVESGFPLAVSVQIPKMNGHAIVCIGHGKKEKREENETDSAFLELSDYPCINSADLYKDYVLMDDNQCPYRIETFNKFTLYHSKGAFVNGFIVPLPKRIFLEAMDAETIARGILENEHFGLPKWSSDLQENITEENPLVFRLFLTSARKYRGVRIKNAKDDNNGIRFYSGYPLPRFVWVAEIATLRSYNQNLINGEIIIDATAASGNATDRIIMIRYGCKWIHKFNNEWVLTKSTKSLPYPMYINNLKNCGG